MILHQPYRTGIRKVTAIASVVAAGGVNSVTLHDLPTGRTGIVRKVHIMNNNAGQTVVQLGTGLAGAYAQAMPGWVVPAGIDVELGEDVIPAFEFTADITVAASVAAAAPNNVQVMVEVEEFVNTSG
jgi:hypothetical protein